MASVCHAKEWRQSAWLDGPRPHYPSEVRPSASLGRREFGFVQRRDAGRVLFDSATRAWDAYCFALSLLNPAACRPDRPDPDLSALALPWDNYCLWYRNTVFDNQLDLFLCSHQTELRRWSNFTERRCVQPILRSPQLTRSFLRATRMIEGHDGTSTAAIGFIVSFFTEITASLGCASDQTVDPDHSWRTHYGN